MRPGPGSASRGVYGLRLLRRPPVQRTALALLVAIVLGFRLLQFAAFSGDVQWGYDFAYYWRAATALLDGGSVYSPGQLAGPYAPQGQDGFLYPPPFAAAMIPFALAFADPRIANWAWAAIGAAIVVAVVLVVGRREGLFDPERLGGMFAGRRRWLAVALAFTLPPVIGELVLGNVHLLLLGLVGVAWLGIRAGTRGGDRVAGIAVGLAALVKVFPAIVVVWFVLTRRWTATAWTALGAVAATLFALPLTGIAPWLDYPTVLANLSAPADTTDTLAPTVWLAPLLGFTLARIVVSVAMLALVAWASLRRPAPIAFAATVVASLLMAPALYHHYVAILVLPFILAAAHLPGRGAWLIAAYLLLWGGDQPALGELAWVVNRALPTLGVLVLFGALVAGPRRTTEAGGPAPATAGTFG